MDGSSRPPQKGKSETLSIEIKKPRRRTGAKAPLFRMMVLPDVRLRIFGEIACAASVF
jgi:hypothetical protein